MAQQAHAVLGDAHMRLGSQVQVDIGALGEDRLPLLVEHADRQRQPVVERAVLLAERQILAERVDEHFDVAVLSSAFFGNRRHSQLNARSSAAARPSC